MRHSDDLFQLIHSLSKSEKRYFKMYTSLQKGKKNYRELFDAIDAQDVYDETALKAKFQDERFVRQFNVAKYYLYKLILKALRAFYNENSSFGQTRDLIREGIILFERGLYRQAGKQFTKAKKLAEHHGHWMEQVIALGWESRIEAGKDISPESLEAIQQQRRDIIREMTDLYEADYLQAQFIVLFRRRRSAPKETAVKLEALVNHPFMASLPDNASFDRRSEYYLLWATYTYGTGRLDRAEHYTEQFIRLMDTSPEHRAQNLSRYMSMQGNLLLIQRRLGKHQQFRLNLAKIKQRLPALIRKSNLERGHLEYKFLERVWMEEAKYLIQCGKPESALKVLREIEEQIDKYGEHLQASGIARIYQGLAAANFMVGNPTEALTMNNRVLELTLADSEDRWFNAARVGNLFIHLELENIDLLEGLLRSYERSWSGRSFVYRAEMLAVRLIKALIRTTCSVQRNTVLQKFREEFTELLSVQNERIILVDFPVVDWIDSRIERRPLLSVIQQRSMPVVEKTEQ